MAFGTDTAGGVFVADRCTIRDNSADSWCGGVGISVPNPVVTFRNSTISGNTGRYPAGLSGTGSLTITGCTISGNTTTYGAGGLEWYGGTVVITDTTVSGNCGSYDGGGISMEAGSLSVYSSTVTDNRVTGSGYPDGETGGIFLHADASAVLHDSIVARNYKDNGATPADLCGAFNTASSYNLIGLGRDSTGLTNGVNGNQVGSTGSPINPLLGSLGDHGGPTATHVPLAGSLAIDRGRNVGGAGADQRGRPRICDSPAIANATGGDACDIGAVEVQAPRVAGVFVRGSAWSQGVLDELGSPFGYQVPTGDRAQLDCLSWSNIDRVSIRFTDAITATQNSLTVSSTAGAPAVVGYTYDAASFTGTWTLGRPSGMEAVQLHLADTVTGGEIGWPLDGEWADCVSTISGNAVAGGGFDFSAHVLPGDTNEDATVDCLDYLALKLGFGPGGSPAARKADFDGDGDVDRADYLTIKANFGQVLNCALEFDGQDCVNLPAETLNGQTNVTVESWLNTTRTGQQGIISGANAGNNNEYLIWLDSDTVVAYYTGEKIGTRVTWTVPSLADGRWHHLAVVRNDTDNQTELFLDGVSRGIQATTLSALSVSPGGFVIGQDQDKVGGGFDPNQALYGYLDELRVWDTVLTGEEIRQRMCHKLTGDEPHLVGYWDFEEGTGQVVHDQSPYGRDGTLGLTASPASDDPLWVWTTPFTSPAPAAAVPMAPPQTPAVQVAPVAPMPQAPQAGTQADAGQAEAPPSAAPPDQAEPDPQAPQAAQVPPGQADPPAEQAEMMPPTPPVLPMSPVLSIPPTPADTLADTPTDVSPPASAPGPADLPRALPVARPLSDPTAAAVRPARVELVLDPICSPGVRADVPPAPVATVLAACEPAGAAPAGSGSDAGVEGDLLDVLSLSKALPLGALPRPLPC
jgi:hypothetical protein